MSQTSHARKIGPVRAAAAKVQLSNTLETLESRRLLASVSGYVWEDLDTSRRLDNGEDTLAGWTVFQDDNRNRRLDSGEATTVTDEDGRWEFDDLDDGRYAFGVILQDGYAQTFPSFEGGLVSDFDIDLNFTGTVTSAIQDVFERAARTWEGIIVGDLEDFTDAQGTVDDTRIDVSILSLDGPSGLLGQAAPTSLRPSTSANPFLPYRGFMQFDIADSNAASPEFYDTILHEMGHALGFTRSVWQNFPGLLTGINSNGQAANPRFTGDNATREYNEIFGRSESSVPMEPSSAGPGSGISHFRESVFGNELMTPFAGPEDEVLSRVTIGLMQDIGYTVDYSNAEQLTPGFGISSADDNAGTIPALEGVTQIGESVTGPVSLAVPFEHVLTIRDGNSIENINFGVRLNSRPKINGVVIDPGTQAIGQSIQIVAAGVSDVDGDPIRSVTFYRESNGEAGLQTTGDNPDEFVSRKLKKSRGRWVAEAATDNLGAGTSTYYARAMDDLGTTVTKAGSVIIVEPQTIPNKPNGLMATALGSDTVRVDWNDRSDDEIGFVLQRSTDPLFRSDVNGFILPENTTTFLDTDLGGGADYYYRVRAYNTAGRSANSNTDVALTLSTGEVIVDSTPASTKGSFTTIETGVDNDDVYGGSYLASDNNARGSRATFTPDLIYDGTYFIYVQYQASEDNSSAVPVDVVTAGDKFKRTILDQTERGGGWVLLGKYNLKAGNGTSVRFNSGLATAGTVTADAVRFLPSGIPSGNPPTIPLGFVGPRATTYTADFVGPRLFQGIFSDDNGDLTNV